MNIKTGNVFLELRALEKSAFKQLIGKADPVIVEIGANDGHTTAEFLNELPTARIYCFEPEPRAIAKFKSRIRQPNVKLFECAVGKENGFVTFNQSSGGQDGATDWDQSGSIRKPKSHTKEVPWVKFETQIEVPITRLDDWAKAENISSVDLIWADTQGAESDMIEGGSSVLKNTRFLYTEYSNQEFYEGQISLDTMCDALEKLDFRLIRLFSWDALFSNHRLNKPFFDSAQGTIDYSRNAPCPCGSGHKFKYCHGKAG